MSLSGISEDAGDEEESDDQEMDDVHADEVPMDYNAAKQKDSEQSTTTAVESSAKDNAGYERVLSFMEKIKPKEEEGGISSWSKTQMAETPTLLPELKFHDLVFGHDLGSGSFGTVRYARLIERSKTRSKWPEYAVKIVSTDKIRELGYEASIQREIAVLRVLSHPGIARLVSSFRFREGAYLVLEYASKGDLHNLLRQQGSLDHDATRFVIGEIVAALASIHDLGLVYGDLKPENIVITEIGHIKLTDFGGCRPVTAEAKARIQSIAANALRDLRDGDWRENVMINGDDASNANSAGTDEGEKTDSRDIDMAEDSRVEGTTAYLPPEVVLGAIPTPAADTWALGCVMYQCLSGRPPLMEIDDEATRHRIVTFDTGDGSGGMADPVDQLFQDKHSLNISQSARQFIRKALGRVPTTRPDMQKLARDEFFLSEGTNVFDLHGQTASTLEVGSVAPPAADAKWARRQLSSIWTPQPAQYALSLDGNDDKNKQKGMKKYRTVLAALAASPIPEGKEATAFYSTKAAAVATGTLSDTMTATPSVMPPPSSTRADMDGGGLSSSLGRISERNPLSSG
eukprot:CAMPEP_0172450846 /NCGR_PEP_ID=MMETSP1065-20121228/9056_1 /TAXON_ID=265537 /ORGANISM="Amphiprora paludosa, Strain CCMP125" /LENGTH=571 /DNA_ID=CAMNT_0013202689 /DNA_START=1 /DNA_END=1716 /DNA_ORIENTATION=-